MTKLAQLIAKQEGYYVAGSLPQRNNNPGDLRHGNLETHPDNQPNSVGAFATPEEGWAALERQLMLDSGRDWTLEQLIYSYAPPVENDTEKYLQFVCDGLGCAAQTPVADALKMG